MNIIDYMPQRYSHRFPAWKLLLIFWISIAPPIGVGIFFGVSRLHIIVLVCCLLTATAAYVWRLIGRGTWECRIEGDVLSFHRPNGRGWVVVEIGELDEFLTLDFPNHDRTAEYELVLRGGKRFRMDVRAVGPLSDFQKAIHGSNPAVGFGKRDGNVCHFCGADLRVRRDRCPDCGTPISDDEIA